MKDIKKYFYEKRENYSIVNFFKENSIEENEPINEGLKDILKYLKAKFNKVINYVGGFVAKLTGSYWCAVSEDGKVLNAISPLTAGQAYVDGRLNKKKTAVILNSTGANLTKCKCSEKDALNLYGKGTTLDRWKQIIGECEEAGTLQPINEVKLQSEDPQAKYNVVDTNELKEEIAMCFTNKNLARLLIWGAPGIGKTAILRSVLDSVKGGKEYNLIVKTLSNETPDNFTLPKYVEVDGQDKATDVPKTWLPVYKPTGIAKEDTKLDNACGKGLLFIDELSRATPQVLNVMLPLINEGEFNGYRLGSGWVIIAASNRMEDEMSGQSDIGNALSNRFRQLYFEPTCKTWSEWARQQGFMSPLLVSWLNMSDNTDMAGGRYFYYDPNESGENDVSKLMCTPRSWTNAMRQLAIYSETGKLEGFSIFDIPRNIIGRTLNQYVPAEAVDSFLAFLEIVQRVGDIEKVISDIWKSGKTSVSFNKKELHQISIPFAQLLIAFKNGTLPTEEEYENLCKWLISINSDQITMYVDSIFKDVYGHMLKENERNAITTIIYSLNLEKKEVAKGAADNKLKVLRQVYNPLFEAYGMTEDTFPDYSDARFKLIGKYKEILKSTVGSL